VYVCVFIRVCIYVSRDIFGYIFSTNNNECRYLDDGNYYYLLCRKKTEKNYFLKTASSDAPELPSNSEVVQ